MDAFGVPGMALAPLCLKYLREIPASGVVHDSLDRLNHRRVLVGLWPVAVDRSAHVQDLAC